MQGDGPRGRGQAEDCGETRNHTGNPDLEDSDLVRYLIQERAVPTRQHEIDPMSPPNELPSKREEDALRTSAAGAAQKERQVRRLHDCDSFQAWNITRDQRSEL